MKKRFNKVYVEITNSCNLDCDFCIKNKRKQEFITIDNFKTVLNVLKDYTNYLYLHILGEPLLHPKINEIIDKSYETTMKEELMCLFYPESQRYDLDEIKALKNEKNSLETLYQGWMDSDLNINQLLEDNTDEIVAGLAEEYKTKQSKKKAKER